MQTITTKYHGATNTRGSRISATSESGQRVTIAYDDALSTEQAHRVAAQALCDKLGWHWQLVQGATKRGYVFVPVTRGDITALAAAQF